MFVWLCVDVCLYIKQGGTTGITAMPTQSETCNLARKDLLMKPDSTPKPDPLYGLQSPAEKWTWIGIFMPAEPHSPCDANFYV